jgi:hypothetical protein
MSSRSREKRSEQQLWQGANTNINTTQNFNTPQNFNTSFTVGQNNANTTFNVGQNNTSTFTAGQTTNTFTSGQNTTNQNFTAGQNFSQPQTYGAGQNISFQANFQDNNSKVQYQSPTQFGSSGQNQQPFGQVDFKVQSNIQSPIKQNAPTTHTPFQANNPNNFNSFSTNIKLNENSTGNFTYNSYQE